MNNDRKTAAVSYIDNGETITARKNSYIAGLNCSSSFIQNEIENQYRANRFFNCKTGYHMILGLEDGEGNPAVMLRATREAMKSIFGNEYQIYICVHSNTERIHAHIYMDRISMITGDRFSIRTLKELSDFRHSISRVLKKYNLMPLRELDSVKAALRKTKRKEIDDGLINMEYIAMKSIDEAIRQSGSIAEFRDRLKSFGYSIVRAGKNRFPALRLNGDSYRLLLSRLGENYTLTRIEQRIKESSGKKNKRRYRYRMPSISDRIRNETSIRGSYLKFMYLNRMYPEYIKNAAYIRNKKFFIGYRYIMKDFEFLCRNHIESQDDINIRVRSNERKAAILKLIGRITLIEAVKERVVNKLQEIEKMNEMLKRIRKNIPAIEKELKESLEKQHGFIKMEIER